MKRLTPFVILYLLWIPAFSQTEEMEQETNKNLSILFLGFDTTKKPEKIEEEYRRPIDVIGHGDKVYEPEQNIVNFTTHKLISGFTSGRFNINYLYRKEYFDDYGLYQASVIFEFASREQCIAEYNKLVKLFEMFGPVKIATTNRDPFDMAEINSEEVLFLKDSFDEFPRLEIRHSYELTDNTSFLRITLMKSWSNTTPSGIRFFGN
jgi:hypothetical protein